MKSLPRWLERLAPSGKALRGWTLLIIGLGSIAALDHVTGSQVSFSLFYLAPISMFTWQYGQRRGMVASAVAAAVWYLVDRAGNSDYSHAFIPFWNSGVRFGFFVVVCWLLARLKESIDREGELARRDPLTGLLNRRGFAELAQREIERADRVGTPLSIAYLDLDGFKDINDTHGHAVGDRVLVTTARVMDLVLRRVDIPARLGGDEFVLAMPDTDVGEATITIDRLANVLTASGVEASIGAVVFRAPPTSVAEALASVDAIMYEVKGDPTKRVAIHVASPPTEPDVPDRPGGSTPIRPAA
jgi:diguanylate cyclase (GGDEF)-like protein